MKSNNELGMLGRELLLVYYCFDKSKMKCEKVNTVKTYQLLNYLE